ncbi:MAG: GNAT family N-acetyltransferase [Nanoarchaeota archaeon]
MIIRKFREGDTKPAALIVMNTFRKFNKTECFQRSAVQRYLNRYDPQKNTQQELLKSFKSTPIFFVATEHGKIIGMIRGRPDRIINLFVDSKQHKRGIGRLLVERFEEEAGKQGSKLIRLRSSLYATGFYQRMGYKKTTGIRKFHGLKVNPMRKIFLKTI